MNGIFNFKEGQIPLWLKESIWKLRWYIGFEALLLCILGCATVISAKLSQYAIDEVIVASRADNLCKLCMLASGFVAMIFLIKYMVARLSAFNRQRLNFIIRTILWRRWVDGGDALKYKAGDIGNRLQGDVGLIGDVTISVITTITVSIGALCVSLIVLLRCNIFLSVIAFSFIPGYLILYTVFGDRIQRATGNMRLSMDHLINFVLLRWGNLREIQILDGTHTETDNFKMIATKQYNAGMRLSFIKNLSSSFSEVMMTGWNLMLFITGAYFVMRGIVTLGELIATQMIAGQIVGPVQHLLNLNLSIRMTAAAVNRIQDVEMACRNSPCHNLNEVVAGTEGLFSVEQIELMDVQIHPTINKKINLNIPIAERVYIEGVNGAGKSSVCRIISGYDKPISGVVRVNLKNISYKDHECIRSHILLLTHAPFLFAGTIRDNLLYGLEYADEGSLCLALKSVGLKEWIKTLPDGLNYWIEDTGCNLSNGQRQRINCARAILRKHRIVVIDEALSGVDEMEAERILKELNHGRNLVITRVTNDTDLMVVAK